MIRKDASGKDAELPINLFNALTGAAITGHTWMTGEVLVALPNGTLTNATVANIVEKGRGIYALQLTALQTATTGGVYLVLDTSSGYLPHSWQESISDATSGGIIKDASGKDAEIPINLFDTSGNPITGHTWVTGEVLVALPNGTFTNASVANIVEKGRGKYALQLTAAQTATTGAVYLVLNTTNGYQPHAWQATINDGSGVGSTIYIPIGGPGTAIPVPSPFALSDPEYVDLVGKNVDRLCEYSRSGDFDLDAFLASIGFDAADMSVGGP